MAVNTVLLKFIFLLKFARSGLFVIGYCKEQPSVLRDIKSDALKVVV
jgi:hypothetical protein